MRKTIFAIFVLGIGLMLAGCSTADGKASDSSDSSKSRNIESKDSSVKSSNPKDVEFEDFLVERCVREALGKNWDEKVTAEELASLKELTISWKKDITLGTDLLAQSYYEYLGYVNLADLKYLTGLEDLQLDFGCGSDMFENMDAIADCKQLKSLVMPLPLMDSTQNVHGYIGKGYRYLRDIFAQLPALETVDFGMSVPESLQELLQPAGSERKIVFSESENPFARSRMSDIHIKTLVKEGDVYALSSEELSRADVDKDVEDVIIKVESGAVFDCETLADFKNIKTLIICNDGNYILDPKSQLIHPEALSQLPNLYSLSLYNTDVDFEGCKFPNLRELCLVCCDVKDSFGSLKLPLLRELSLILTNRDENDLYDPGADIWSNMPELHYFQTCFMPEDKEGLVDVFEKLKKTAKLESLILEYWGTDEDGFTSDMISQVTEDLSLKTLFFAPGTNDQIDLQQIKCNDTLENFACIAARDHEHLTEFLNTHPNLSTVVVTNGFRTTDEDIWAAYCMEVIEEAVKNPNLSMLSFSADGISEAQSAFLQDPHMMSLYEAGIYDSALQYRAFIQDMDVETYYQDLSGSD